MQPITVQDISYQFHTWSELGDDIFTLSKKILEADLQFDRLIALAKGGLAFSRSLADYLNIKEVSTIQVEFYTGINSKQSVPVITQSLPVKIRDEKVLLFDDLVDTGKTMELAKTYLEHHGAQSIHIATLFEKPHSVIKPDFFVHETTAWVIFPNEVRETVETLHTMWTKKGLSKSEIERNLVTIGLPQNEVELFLTAIKDQS